MANTEKKNISFNLTIKIVMVAVILLLINIIGSRLFFRLDLTEYGQYSLSPATKKILSTLEDRINVEAYFSSDIPERIQNVRNQLRDLLEEFRARSNGKLQFKFIDPGKDRQLKRKLRMRGIPEVNLNVFEKDRASVTKAYLGLAVLFGDKTEAIPVIDRIQNMEYQLVALIKKITSKEEFKIGYTIAKGEKDIDKSMMPLARLLRKQYKLTSVDLTKGAVPKDVKTLLVLGPSETYDEKAVYYLDQFVMRGGKIFFAIDRVVYNDKAKFGLMGKVINTGLEKFIEHLGVRVEANLVSDMLCGQAPFRTQYGTIIQPYTLWPKLANFNKSVGMVNRMGAMVLQWASSVVPIKKKDVKTKILAFTSNQSWAQRGYFNLDPNFAARPKGNFQKFNMAAIVDGRYKSFFSGKKLPEGVKPDLNAKGVSPRVQHIVIGDSDFIVFALRSRGAGDNIKFLLNGIDFLTIGSDLIGIRSKNVQQRPLEATSDTVRSLIKFLTIFFMPFAVIIIGVMRFIRRRNIRRMFESMQK